jgi:hypothetical protein
LSGELEGMVRRTLRCDLIGSGEAQERGIVGETPNLAARL